MVGLVNHNDLESLFCTKIHLLCLRYFLQEILYNDTVEVSDIGGSDFEVVNGRDDVELELPVRCRLEYPRVNFDLFDTGSKKLA
jgi:hypothetical protein